MNFVGSVERRAKLKDSDKNDEYLDLAEEKMCNIKVTLIPIVICAPCTFAELLVQGLLDLEIKG